MMSTQRKQRGFTIVELLIVIVVIGILAAITIVAYNGIQTRARASASSSAAAQAAKKLAAFAVDGNGYPATLAAADVQDNAGTTYQYTVNNSANPPTYCLTATTGTSSYTASSTNPAPTAGACAGHGVGGVAPITNLAVNPSFEANTNTTNPANGATITRQASSAIFGSYGLGVSAPANGIGDSGVSLPNGSMTAGTTYTFSASVRSLVDTSYRISVQGSFGTGNSPVTAFTTGEVKRLSTTVTATGTGRPAVYILRSNGSLVTNFDVDGVMQTETSTSYNFADGTTPNWIWNGTAHNATSTGPPV